MAEGLLSSIGKESAVGPGEAIVPRYTVFLDPDPDGIYTVTVPALPGVVTQGDTIEEALAMARDAVQLHLRGLLEDGESIPTEIHPPQLVTLDIAVPDRAAVSPS
jgi:predicted RNase H-like HicB family nuclease